MSDEEPTEDEVRAALGRLMVWPEIARSAQLARFLDYIVSRKLDGGSQGIKAYAIAVDVFGRPADFDPQADPIVRVQARRLRGLIEQYYSGPGAQDPVRIELPTGRYVPEFSRFSGTEIQLPVAAEPARREWRREFWPILAVVTAILLAVAVGSSFWAQRSQSVVPARGLMQAPVIAVMELQSLTGAPGDVGMVAGLAVELVTDLEQFESMNVLYGGNTNAAGPADYILSGIVRRDAGGLQYGAILTDVASNTVIWNRTISVDAAEMVDRELLNEVSGELSRTLGSPRGPLHMRARKMLEAQPVLDGGENLYLCRVLFDLYREVGTFGAGDRAQRCYAGLPEGDRDAGQALAAEASLVLDGIVGPSAEEDEGERLASVGQRLAQAVEVSPISGFVWEQQARYFERIGDDAAAEAAYSSALQLNPANTDTLASRARHLALVGQLDAASSLADLAVNSAPNPPDWYLLVPALEALEARNYRLAAISAQRYAEADRELGPILAVMAAQGLGDQGIVASYLPRVLEVGSFRSAGILTQLRKRIRDETLIRDIRAALLGAGVPPAVLNGAF